MLLIALAQGLIAEDQKDTAEEGWIELFNGKDLTGWKVNENPDSVTVEDGMIVTHGDRAHLFYVGDDGQAEFKNFHFKAQVKTMEKSNSGIYFHTKFQKDGWPNKGYEAQVNNTHSDPKKTGGLYNVQDNSEAPAKDGEWFDYEIIVEGKHIVIKINDKTISDYTEPADLDRPERQLSSGTFALQAHDPVSKVYFRNLKVKRLQD
jgi:NADH:ubiquinone oxidoreductase subunit